jgi:hypothetical protein
MKNNHGSPRKTSDFNAGTESRTLVLKERTWKFEVSRSKTIRFLRSHKIAVVSILAILLVGGITRYIFVGLASTADFYPSSCLGNWQNVENALGKPNLSSGASASAFTTANSASLGTSTAQMFCGNFSGDTDINTLTEKSFQEADLVFSWSFVFPEAASAPVIAPDNSGDNSSDTVSSTIIAPTSGDVESGGGTTTPPAATDIPPAQTVAPVTQDVAPPAEGAPAAPSDAPAAPSDTSPTSWLRDFVGVAYADETSTLATDASTTSGIGTTTSSDGTNYVQVGTSTVPETTTTPISVNTSMFQNIVVPSSTGDAVISIVYSTDGVTWQPLVNIDSANWQLARYKIPIHSWAELQHLQIAFVGLGASSSPQVFLDAAGVEVSYVDAPKPQQQPDATSTPDINPDTDSANPIFQAVVPPTPVEVPPVQAFKQVFDPFAGQQCVVTPFSESIVAGGGGSFLLKLTPPAVSTSSRGSSSVVNGAAPFLYDASVGSLATGITATVIPEGPGMDTIGITTAATVAPGSYNAVVVYKERQNDGSIAPNFCQFNLVVR